MCHFPAFHYNKRKIFYTTGCPKKMLLLSGFEFLTLGEVFLGVVFHQKLIGDGLMCPKCVFHVENECIFPYKTSVFA